LARALVWEPKILLLDEAISAVDGASDAAFRAAPRNAVLSPGLRCSHHRPPALYSGEADRVVAMSEGRIVEEGTPEELIRRGGRFAAMRQLETAG
jgi:ABC-type multidrug transport system fused ATPase/permease subunit